MTYEATWGPWIGVPRSKLAICAVEGCEHRGEPHTCLYDGRRHHHGCIHYDCTAAEVTKHGLTFRDGWGWLCASHYAVLVEAQKRHELARTSAGRALTEARTEERLRQEGIIGGRYEDEPPAPVGIYDGSLHAVGCQCGACSTARIADEWDPRMGRK